MNTSLTDSFFSPVLFAFMNTTRHPLDRDLVKETELKKKIPETLTISINKNNLITNL